MPGYYLDNFMVCCLQRRASSVEFWTSTFSHTYQCRWFVDDGTDTINGRHVSITPVVTAWTGG